MGAVMAERETGAIRRAARQEVVRLDEMMKGAAPAVAALEALVADLVEADIPASLQIDRPGYREDGLPLTICLPRVHPIRGGHVPPWPLEGLESTGYEVWIRPGRGVVTIEGPVPLGEDEDDGDRRDPEWFETHAISDGMPGRPLKALLDSVRELAIKREVELQTRASFPTP